MKKFTKYINEHCDTADVNQGNALLNSGVSNHLTPIGNILSNVKNFFCIRQGIVASIAEDGVSIKLNCSRFASEQQVKDALFNPGIMRGTCLANYIKSQGLDKMKVVSVGQFYVVYFSPNDVKTAQPGKEPEQANLPCKEMKEYNVEEAELININEGGEDEELKDLTREKIKELVTSKDKVKAAKQLELIVGQSMELPREYYFAGVKSQTGEESIALRWKYTKRAGKNQTNEITKSLINIYDDGKDGIFVPDYDKDSMFNLPDEVKKLIDNILDLLDAQKTNDPAVFSMEESKDKHDEDKKDEDNDKKDDSSDDKKDDVDKKDDSSNDKKDDEGDDDKDKKKDDGDLLS